MTLRWMLRWELHPLPAGLSITPAQRTIYAWSDC